MVTKMKVIMPEWMKRPLRAVKSGVIRAREFPMIHAQPELHRSALEKVRKKEKVKVAFFATHSSVWKYEGVYKLMAADPRFDPIVVVCPVVNYGKENMLEEMVKSFRIFQDKGYKVVMAYDDQTDSYLDVRQDIGPDIIFYTNPYKGLIDDRYYITNFRDTLTCYVQYAYPISNSNVVNQVDLLFHNLLWMNFQETPLHEQEARNCSRSKGRNAVLTGYPGTDLLVYGQRTDTGRWKNPDNNLKRVIWAPHHTIEEGGILNLSSFLVLHKLMIDLVETYRSELQIAFKPHPLLKVKLYDHKDWGKERTDAYYSYWEDCPNGQLETDDYIDLFNSSDAMIHDSGSFIAEYLFCGKPVLFFLLNKEIRNRLSDFGNQALDHHYHASDVKGIIDFLERVVFEDKDEKSDCRRMFYEQYLVPPNKLSASENIYNTICHDLFC